MDKAHGEGGGGGVNGEVEEQVRLDQVGASEVAGVVEVAGQVACELDGALLQQGRRPVEGAQGEAEDKCNSGPGQMSSMRQGGA